MGGFMEIPYQRIEEETLRQLIKEFVLREGTDYSHQDFDIKEKIHQVMKQLKIGTAILVFNTEDETFNIIQKG